VTEATAAPEAHLQARREELAGWGRYPVEFCDVLRPRSFDELADVVARASQRTLIPRGLGRSYGDSALNRHQGVIQTDALAGILGFDPRAGVVHCSAALSLSDLLAYALPRGFFFPVTPGTKFITIGGAIAADVHGKNHHRSGSMSAFVAELRLLCADGEVRVCSREERPELFWATVGGMGLTGVIVDARLRLRAVETGYVCSRVEQLPDLDRTLESMRDADEHYDYGVAWIDCLRQGATLGRAVLFNANHAALADLPADKRANPYAQRRFPSLSLPFRLPNVTVNSLTARAFNALYHGLHPTREAIEACDRFFYPLDSVRHWNRVYGSRGALQYQALLPPAATREGLVALLEELGRSGNASFLAVLKTTGPASGGLLSFPRPGHTLALDLPRTRAAHALVKRLDALVLRYGGRLYLAKDACMAAEACAEMYPELERFREIKGKYDPQQRFSSSQGRRLGLLPRS